MQGRSVTPTETTLTVTGCAPGLVVVQLRDEANNKTLNTVTVTVLPLPTIDRYERTAYRWFHIYWSANADYVTLSVEWFDVETRTWNRLPTEGLSGARAILYSGGGRSTIIPGTLQGRPTHADVRGIGYASDPISVRVVGSTTDGVSAGSAPFPVPRAGTQPDANGHLHDHTVRYETKSDTDSPELSRWVINAAPDAVAAWANLLPSLSLKACDYDCDENRDGDIIRVRINEFRCDITVVACVTAPDVTAPEEKKSVETWFVRDRYLYFRPLPTAELRYKWTDDPSRHGQLSGGLRMLWVGAVAVHEFGHAFGLKDYYEGSEHDGVMNAHQMLKKGRRYITAQDIKLLEAIYESHTPNQGW